MVNGGLKAPGVRRFCFWILSRASPEFCGYIAMKTVVPRLNVGVEYAAHEEAWRVQSSIVAAVCNCGGPWNQRQHSGKAAGHLRLLFHSP